MQLHCGDAFFHYLHDDWYDKKPVTSSILLSGEEEGCSKSATQVVLGGYGSYRNDFPRGFELLN